MSLRIDPEACILCAKCVKACPYEALELTHDELVVNEKCVLCGACVPICPVDALAIELAKEPSPKADLEAYKGVWVFGEHHQGKLHPVVFELLGAGKDLARKRNCLLEVVVLGSDLSTIPRQLSGTPADTVYLVEHHDLQYFTAETFAEALAQTIEKEKPEILLAGATSLGRALMPRAAVLVETGLTADCTGLDIDEESGRLLQTRPAFGGNIMATIVCPHHRPQMATVRPKVMKPTAKQGKPGPVIKRWNELPARLARWTEVLGVTREADEEADIADADILVAGGRGVGGPEGFEILKALAREVGGQLSASRAAVDSGWISYAHQVGQTGKTVQPKLYIACGISGSVQHRVGMQSAGTIVAINTDPNAPIFQIADFGIVGEFAEVAPEIARQLKSLKKEKVAPG